MAFTLFIGLLCGCSIYPIKRIPSQPNHLLAGDSCLVIENRLGELSVLFSNGLVLFCNSDLLQNQKQFMDNNLYECRYCWGRYQYQPPRLVIFQPLSVGYLNLPGSYPIRKLEYQVDNGNVTSLTNFPGKVAIQKTKLLINPDLAWLAKGRAN